MRPADAAASGSMVLLSAQTLPEAALATWDKTLLAAPLWSGPDAEASQFSVVPAGTIVKVLGPPQGNRLPVYVLGDGASRQPGMAWADLDALQPTDLPDWITSSDLADPSAPALVPGGPVRATLEPPPTISAWKIAVMDGDTGELLYGQNPHDRVAIASTTKVATTLVALRRSTNLEQVFDVSVSGSALAAMDGSSIMGLEPGERVTLETLLYGMMLPSGNDAAEQVALSLGGTRERYLGWMNDLATSLNMQDTHFASPSGMDTPGHFSSAYDMAVLSRAAMQDERFRTMAAAIHYHGDGYSLTTINRLLGVYPGADGVKVGFTDDAGKTMIASATRDGHRVFVSVMHSVDLPSDTTAMLNWAWRAFRWS
jgi:D-alanyl-D-alanine carboxypeptidase